MKQEALTGVEQNEAAMQRPYLTHSADGNANQAIPLAPLSVLALKTLFLNDPQPNNGSYGAQVEEFHYVNHVVLK